MHKSGTPPPKAWTVMVYMVASKDRMTEALAFKDIAEMMRVESIDHLNVLIHLDRFSPRPSERIFIHPGGRLSDDLPGPTNSGDPRVLAAFIDWCHHSFPAQHYLLVLWGHAMGLEFGADHGDPLTVHELSTVLDHLPFKLDILGCNACDMASAEGVYELRNSAQYLVAWENTVPYRGWPYTQILNRLAAGEVLTADQLGRDIVRQSAETSVKLTMFDLAQAEGLGEKVKDLAAALTDAKAAESKGILKAFSSAAQTDFAPLIDLVDLCNKLRRDVADAAARPLSDAAGKIVAFLIPGNDGFILENSHDRKLNGVGIFAPSRMTQSQDDVDEMLRREKPYKNLRLMTEQMEEQNTSWASFVYGLMDRVLDGHSDQETPVKSPAKK